MEFIQHLIPENILSALGWTVLHSLWQAFAIALLLAAFLLVLHKRNARHRYLAANLALGVNLVLAVITFFILLESGQQVVAPLTGGISVAPTEHAAESALSAFLQYFDNHLPLIVMLWLVGVFFFSLRMLGGLLYIQQLRSRQLQIVSNEWHEKLKSYAHQMRWSRPVQLAESALVRVPMAIGWLKPVILLPLGAVNNLSPREVEAILAHELAHIARYDYLLNLLQTVVESLFYFNPAIWWISTIVRTERENCCDDVAVRLCGDSLAYAKALVALQELHPRRGASAPVLAMSFSKNKSRLLQRIQRLLQEPRKKSNTMEKFSATMLLLLAVLLLTLQANTPFSASGDEDAETIVAEAIPTMNLEPVDDHFQLREATDTIPHRKKEKSKRTFLHRDDNGEEVEVIMKNDKITYLKIDGQEIPESDYGKYQSLVEALMADVPPPPPPPPAPDVHFEAPTPPTPPAAPKVAEPPAAPPAPPAPPAPSVKQRKIITKKDGNGTTIIIESEQGDEPIEIQVKEGKKSEIIINGQEIGNLKKGDRTIILEKIEGGAPEGYFWNHEGEFHFEVEPQEGRYNFFPDDHYVLALPKGALEGELRGHLFNFQEHGLNRERMEEMQKAMEEMRRDGNFNRDKLRQLQELQGISPHILELKEGNLWIGEDYQEALERQEEARNEMLRHREIMELEQLRKKEYLEKLQLELLENQKASEKLMQERKRRHLIRLEKDDGRM